MENKTNEHNRTELIVAYPAEGIARITFNRPHALNALNLRAMDSFARAVDVLAADDALRAVILTGAGTDAFCSGGDLYELAERPAESDAREFITLMGDALLRLERLPVPVIAAMNGYALGGGSEIALACDLRIADATIRMGFVQIRLALTPGWGAGQRLLRTVGYARAMEILLVGKPMNADELRARGLVNQIVPEGEALAHAHQFAERIAAHPPETVRAVKALLQAGLTHNYDDALAIERDLFPPLWASPAHLDAVEAFIQKSAEKNTTDLSSQLKSED